MKFLVEISENGFTKLEPVPARMNMSQASALLGISRTDMSHLVAVGEFDLIGSPERNQERFLCAEDILTKARNKRWLARVTDLLYRRHAIYAPKQPAQP